MTHPRRLGVDGVVDAPSDGIDVPRWRGLATEEEAPATKGTTIGLDLRRERVSSAGSRTKPVPLFLEKIAAEQCFTVFALQPHVGSRWRLGCSFILEPSILKVR
jgi:hypothetical protein